MMSLIQSKSFKTGMAILFALLLAFTVTGCGDTSTEEEAPAAEPHTLTGSGEGYAGTITVEVEMLEDEIQSIEVIESSDTPGIADGAFDAVIGKIIENQGTEDIDVVSGATGSSQGLLDAVEDALAQ
ncbi:FMN-binding domain-containing protein [Tindallia magadiensis]|uniref:FMN-binding domain-containing protein n=1 Tax=Tindallia magadiensis TaxID=69895 RepID=A0A1I3BVV4_9FIRM|nr:FMN-binding protein [Tindallia magadiensis]SFH66363.1 FMN-binding domain-containing protein [Tindallia magadiensis]